MMFGLSSSLFSQEKVSWSFRFNQSSSTIEMEANMAEGWHLYSQDISDGIGPIPTTFTFEESDVFVLSGETVEPTPITKYDRNFEGELSFFEGQVVFLQEIKVEKSGEVNGVVSFMTCNDEMCFPPKDVSFTLTIDKQ